uniref:VP6 n=1 Tax=Zoersel tick virus TaxID=2867438 RepID=A0A8G0QFP2_9REOV|nr:VP6 [Zoersel tick virus]
MKLELTEIYDASKQEDVILRRRCIHFGDRLAKNYKRYKNKFVPEFIDGLRNRKTYGIIIHTNDSKEKVKTQLITQFHFPNNIKVGFRSGRVTDDMFSIIGNLDVVIVNGFVETESLEVFVLTRAHLAYCRSKKLFKDNTIVEQLSGFVITNITGINLWETSITQNKIIGIGVLMRELPEWFRALDLYCNEKIYTKDGLLNLKIISKYLVPIHCSIPDCFGVNFSARYIHAHVDENYRSESDLNCSLFSDKRYNMKPISVGNYSIYNIKYNDGVVHTICVGDRRLEEFQTFMKLKIVSDLEIIDLLPYLSYYYRRLKLKKNKIVSYTFCNFCESPLTQDIMMLKNSMRMAIEDTITLTLVAPKGSFKSLFVGYLTKYYSDVVCTLDSDDFGRAILEEKVRKGDLDPSALVRCKDYFEYYIFEKFRRFDVPISRLDPVLLSEITYVDTFLVEFHDIWSKLYSKGYGDVPGFLNFVGNWVDNNKTYKYKFVFCHSLFESRLCESLHTIKINFPFHVNDGLQLRYQNLNDRDSLNVVDIIMNELLNVLHVGGNDAVAFEMFYSDVIDLIA